MTVLRSVVRSVFEDYLDAEYPADAGSAAQQFRAEEICERHVRLAKFPRSALLQLAYPELDFANRWCWQQFGPAHGPCQQAGSEYPACPLEGPHTHEGRWLSCWLAKTDYDFGYNEWCFASADDLERFLVYVPSIHWGEHFPK